MTRPIEDARTAAAVLLARDGRAADATVVRSGGGDDFPEVQAALLALSSASHRADRFERALRCYADETFWERDADTECLAIYDAGDIARAALAGKELFEQHRD